MLVISRHRDEDLIFTHEPTGERFMVRVVDIRGDKVRVGIEASKNITVHRKEVQDAIDRDKGVSNATTTSQRT